MKRARMSVLVVLVAVAMISCAGDMPWRKTAVTTFELLGDGIGAARDTVIALDKQGLMQAADVAKAKALYNKAAVIYARMGELLKLAANTQDAVEKDQLLLRYDGLLADFKAVSYQVYALVQSFKK